MKTIIVTRHPALVALLSERKVITGKEKVFSHVTPDDVRDKNVIGVLPLSLAALANTVTEIPLALEPSDRGKELDINRLREIAGSAVKYKISKIS